MCQYSYFHGQNIDKNIDKTHKMATVTPLLNTKHQSKDGTYQIIIRVIDGQRQRLIPVGHKILEKHWIESKVSGKHPDAAVINSAIATKEAEIKRYLADCQIHNKALFTLT